MEIEFEWDINKELINIDKHGISFVAAANLLLSEHFVAQSNRCHEESYLAIGEIASRVIAVVYTIRNKKYRIISARRARKNEEAIYKKYSQISGTATSHRYRNRLETC
jgi:uncharacterized protein